VFPFPPSLSFSRLAYRINNSVSTVIQYWLQKWAGQQLAELIMLKQL
jgi:hypothetical protein